jgi:hypothetical protein
MRPVRGVITGQKDSTLAIKLESGKTIHTPKKPGLRVGKPVLVYYDFTEAKVRDIKLEVEVKNQRHLEVVEREPPEPELPMEEIYDIEPLVLDSGALPPICEGCWEFYNPDNTYLETPDFEEYI